MSDDDTLTESAGLVADGQPVDWEAQRRRAPGTARGLDALIRVERIAGAWRALGVVPEPDDDPAVPDEPAVFRWGPLEARAKLGEGTFGEVWRAWDPSLHREVALKLRHRGEDDAGIRQDMDEARRLARVRHPNVVAIHGVDVHDGRAGFWTELVRGRTLERLLEERGPLGAQEAALVGCELCRALAAVHAAGLAHGDVKAGNVMREDGGRIVLMDFGSGRELHAPTQGEVTGSPLTSAPEVLTGAAAAPASDLYALGALLFRLTTGRHPVEADSLAALRARHERGPRVSLRTLRPDLPTAFVTAVESALEFEPARRPADAGALERMLAPALAGPAPSAGPSASTRARRRFSPWLAWAAALALLAVTAIAFWPRRAGTPAPALVDNAPPAARRAGTAPRPEAPARTPLPAPVVSATLWRGRESGRTALADGDVVAPGDRLWLEYRGAEPTYLYVLDEDDHGATFALFPVAGTDLANPLHAHADVRVPGTHAGQPLDWTVTSAGGHERLLIVASRRPIAVLEDLVAAVPAAAPDRPVTYPAVPEGALAELRGIGALVPSRPGSREGRLESVERALAAREGLWVHHVELGSR